jgi:spermidine/putrescine transport system substrate-binding protein
MTQSERTGSQEISRRRVLQGAAFAGFATFLAACGTKGTGSSASAVIPSASAAATSASAGPPTPKPSPAAAINWVNWSYYMDYDEATKTFPTLDQFKAQYGTTINYKETIEGNDEFFGTIKPQLEQGAPIEWDIVVLTDWMAARLIRLDWVEQFDLGNMPNFSANLLDEYRSQEWDPNTDHHAPWQSGMTGLGYNVDVTGELDSLAAFYTANSKWTGKVEYLSEMRDTVGLTMLQLGLDPAKPTRETGDQAFTELKKAQAAGIVRDVKGQSYTEDLKTGDAVLAMAWSGDMIQALVDKPSLRFTIAKEGGMLWTDNCLIPKGAKEKYTAELAIDFCYQPEIAAQIEAYVNYICPVKGAREAMLAKDPDIANNPLIFPPDDVRQRLHIFGALNEADEAYYNDKFSEIIGV